jgi:hypothetical protein
MAAEPDESQYMSFEGDQDRFDKLLRSTGSI